MRKFVEKLQQGMLDEINSKKLLPNFYMTLLQETHEL